MYLGRNIHNKRSVFIDPGTRAEHMHIVGSTGEGKSRFIEHMIREDILARNGLCLIDPHGSLYKHIVTWLIHQPDEILSRRKIILFEAADDRFSLGFNPLMVRNKSNITYSVDRMIDAISAVWDDENTETKPLLSRCLKIMFHVLAHHGLSLCEAHYFTSVKENQVRRYLSEAIENPEVKSLLYTYNYLVKPGEYKKDWDSVISRLLKLLSSEPMRAIFGQVGQTLDLKKAMDEGYIILVNLNPMGRVSEKDMDLLGALFINDLFVRCKERDEDTAVPFYLYIDECARYIGRDIGRILDECRKFGLHAILSHQHLSQLGKPDDTVRGSVMTDAKTKVIFGGAVFKDSEELVKNIFLNKINNPEFKPGVTMPVVERIDRVWFESYSKTRTSTTGRGGGKTTGTGTTNSSGQSTTSVPGGFFDLNQDSSHTASTMSGTSSFDSEIESWSSSESEGESEGGTEGLIPHITERHTTLYSVEEKIYRLVALMVNQSRQHAIIKMPKQEPIFIKTPTVEDDYTTDERLEEFKREAYNKYVFFKNSKDVMFEIGERWKMLEKWAGDYDFSEKARHATKSKKEEPENFRE